MTELHQWLGQRPLLRALLREEGVTWLQVTPSGEVWARRGQGPRALAPLDLATEEVQQLLTLVRAAMEAHHQACDPESPRQAWLEWRNMRWILLGEPLHKGAPALFAQRIRPPRLNADQWVERSWARRSQLDTLTQRLAEGHGILLAAPSGDIQERLAATLLSSLPEACHALVLEPAQGMDTEGLPVTALRRALVLRDAQRQLCQALLESADLLVVPRLQDEEGWRWASLPGPQARLLTLEAESAQDAARLLVQELLAQRPQAEALTLPQDLNLDTLVFCKPTEEGFVLELSTFPERALSEKTRYIPLKPLSTARASREDLPALAAIKPRLAAEPAQEVEAPPLAAPEPPEEVAAPAPLLEPEDPTPDPAPSMAPRAQVLPAARVAAPEPLEVAPEELVPVPTYPEAAQALEQDAPTPASGAFSSLGGSLHPSLDVELDMADVVERPTHTNLEPVQALDEPPSQPGDTPSGPSLVDRLRRRLGRPPQPQGWKGGAPPVEEPPEEPELPQLSNEDSGERRSIAPASRLGGAISRRLSRPMQRALSTDSPPAGEPAQAPGVSRRLSRFGSAAIKRETRFNPVEPERRQAGLRSFGRQEDDFEVQMGGAASYDEGSTQQRGFPDDDLDTIQKGAEELQQVLEASPDEATIQKSARELSRGAPPRAEDSPRDFPGRSSPTIPLQGIKPPHDS